MEADRQTGEEQVATPAQYGELVAAVAATACWIYILVAEGQRLAVETLWILLIALPLGSWAALMRLHFSPTRLGLTIGPWHRYVDLRSLESVSWKMTGGWRSRGTIIARDRSGERVPIYVGRFKRSQEWAPLLLEAAAASGARLDARGRELLEEASSGR